MKVKKTYVLPTLLVVLLAGCETANLNSISRVTEYGAGGKAVHLDAKQRVLLTKSTPIGDMACAEPSPDALSSYSSSFGAGAAVPNQFSASIATAMSEASGSIGLRTQSIQLMRDMLYRACEAYYNRSLNQPMLMQLHERYQDITVGLLAIEQLTGAVVAKQLLLTGTASAEASSQLLNIQRLLDEAIANEDSKKATAEASKAEAEDLDNEATAAEAALDTEQAKPNPDEAKLADLDAKAKAARKAADEARAKADSDEKEAEAATRNREIVENSRNAAATTAEATTTTSGRFADSVSSSNFDTQDAGDVADAVKEIVSMIVNKDHLVDSCLVFLSRPASNSENVVNFCTNYLNKSVKEREEFRKLLL